MTALRALGALAGGEPIVLVDDRQRERHGVLLLAAEAATPRRIAFMVRHTSGFLCVALPGSDCDRLALPPMPCGNSVPSAPAYCVTVDASEGVSTGISATDRALTIAALADPASTRGDFHRPGHVVPVRARQDMMPGTPGHAEAAVELARLAGLRPAAVYAHLVSPDRSGDTANGPELTAFAAEHHLATVSLRDLMAGGREDPPRIVRTGDAFVPTTNGEFRAVTYQATSSGHRRTGPTPAPSTAGAHRHLHRSSNPTTWPS